jgi:aspartyl-tRNA synthetase
MFGVSYYPLSLPGPRASITHQVSSLSPSALYSRTTLGGWLVNRRQANSTLCFLNLKDTSGQVQLVINAKKFGNANQEAGQRAIEEMMRLPLHSVIQVEGTIQHKVSTDKSIKSVSRSGNDGRRPR